MSDSVLLTPSVEIKTTSHSQAAPALGSRLQDESTAEDGLTAVSSQGQQDCGRPLCGWGRTDGGEQGERKQVVTEKQLKEVTRTSGHGTYRCIDVQQCTVERE